VTAERSEQVRQVIALIEGGKSENASCREVGINRATFRAAAMREKAGDEYARALEALAQDQVEKMERTLSDMRRGKIDAQQARVEIDARKWFASKFLPKRYGDRTTLAGDPEAPLAGLSEAAVDAKLKALLGEQ
jgi:hypothetical protein